ncbi:hypothetical protein ACFL54_07340 [Planctomycetota bacterium]
MNEFGNNNQKDPPPEQKNIGLHLKNQFFDFELWDWILLGGILFSILNAPMVYQAFGRGATYAVWGIFSCILCFLSFVAYLLHLATSDRALLMALGVMGSVEFFVSFICWIVLLSAGAAAEPLAGIQHLSYIYGMVAAGAWSSGAFVRFGQTQ